MSGQTVSGGIDRKWEIVGETAFDKQCIGCGGNSNSDPMVVLEDCAMDQPQKDVYLIAQRDKFGPAHDGTCFKLYQPFVLNNKVAQEDGNTIEAISNARIKDAQLILNGDFHDSHLTKPEDQWFSKENNDRLHVIGNVGIALGSNIQATVGWAATLFTSSIKKTGWF